MFVTAQDFNIPPYDISNLNKMPNTFGPYVDREEKDCLIKLLGRLLYEAFVQGVSVEPPENIEQRWIDLRDGAKYHYNGRPYQWVGMKELLRPYVWSTWVRDTERRNSGIGMVKAKAENAEPVTPANRIVRAYNAFSEIAGSECLMEDTLYGFLYNSGDTYLDVIEPDYGTMQEYLSCVFCPPANMNVFNI